MGKAIFSTASLVRNFDLEKPNLDVGKMGKACPQTAPVMMSAICAFCM